MPPVTRAKQPAKELLDTAQVLKWLRISRSTLERRIRDADFPVEDVGDGGKRMTRRYDPDKVAAWMARDGERPAA